MVLPPETDQRRHLELYIYQESCTRSSEMVSPLNVARQWQALYGPKGLPKVIADKLREETTRFLNSPEMKKRVAEQGGEVSTGTPEEFSRFVADEKAKFARLVKEHNIKID